MEYGSSTSTAIGAKNSSWCRRSLARFRNSCWASASDPSPQARWWCARAASYEVVITTRNHSRSPISTTAGQQTVSAPSRSLAFAHGPSGPVAVAKSPSRLASSSPINDPQASSSPGSVVAARTAPAVSTSTSASRMGAAQRPALRRVRSAESYASEVSAGRTNLERARARLSVVRASCAARPTSAISIMTSRAC